MGVTTGGLQPGEYQIITITIPSAPSDVTLLTKDIQDVIDAFNNTHQANPIEVLP